MMKPLLRALPVALLVCFAFPAFAQPPMLPDINAATSKGVNYLSWTSRYENIKSIAVQRSPDSTFNWQTIGYVRGLKKGSQGFIDGHPMPGKNYYRLYIIFPSDLTWFSNTNKLTVDSVDLANQRVMPPNDSMQRYVAGILKTGALDIPADSTGTAPPIRIDLPTGPAQEESTYVRSQYVFTNPFTGHVNVELPDVREAIYSLSFFDGQSRRVLNIPRILEPAIIIDKHNFQKKGLYRFELTKDARSMETGYITIF